MYTFYLLADYEIDVIGLSCAGQVAVSNSEVLISTSFSSRSFLNSIFFETFDVFIKGSSFGFYC